MTGPMHHDVPLDLGQRHPAVDQAPQETARGGDRRRTRWALIQRIRREIARGTYETPDKWEAVVSRLLALRVL
jgi:hypothetical protein